MVTILFNLIKDINSHFTKLTMNPTKVLEEKNALLGPGLATNYWFGYLKWICAARDGDDDDEEEGDDDDVVMSVMRMRMRNTYSASKSIGTLSSC